MVPSIALRGPEELLPVVYRLEDGENRIDVFVRLFPYEDARLTCFHVRLADFDEAFCAAIYLEVESLTVLEPGKIRAAVISQIELRPVYIGSLTVGDAENYRLRPRQIFSGKRISIVKSFWPHLARRNELNRGEPSYVAAVQAIGNQTA